MINNPFLLLVCLMAVVWAVLAARRFPYFQRVFGWLPVPFWCYFLPMAGATVGLLPTQSPLYEVFSRYLLPVCLAWLLMPTRVKALFRLGGPALGALGVGFAGIALGAGLSFALWKSFLPAEAWKAVGALSGSWTGGSANMLALKEALGVPDELLAPVVVVDTFMAYGWMALLIFASGFQSRWDKLVKASAQIPASPILESAKGSNSPAPIVPGVSLPLAILVGVGVAGVSVLAGNAMPTVGAVVSHATWAVFLVTSASLALAATGRFSGSGEKLEKAGTTFLYILLASLGARAQLTAVLKAPVFLALGVTWLLVHGAALLILGRLFRLPLALLATASQACVGGVVSTPLVAAVYRPALAPVGLLMAVLGNILGTYAGFLIAQLCRGMAR